jgi:ribosome-binding ATPase YchF (GTP1/OBG family)
VGEGLGNKFLANIREANRNCAGGGGFVDSDVVHVDGKVDAAGDIETMTRACARRYGNPRQSSATHQKEVKGKKTEPRIALETIDEAKATRFDSGKPLSSAEVDLTPIKELGLLTAKPIIYVFNVDEGVVTEAAKEGARRPSRTCRSSFS